MPILSQLNSVEAITLFRFLSNIMLLFTSRSILWFYDHYI